MPESFYQYLKDLPLKLSEPLKIGSTIYLIRKLSLHVIETKLTDTVPFVEVQWNLQHRYKLNLATNEVLAIEATIRHRQEMKVWYTIWEPHRKALTELLALQSQKIKSGRKFGKPDAPRRP